MDKVKEKLLEDFKRANKDRKIKLANKFGFSTVEEYLNYLTGVTGIVEETFKEEKVKPVIHNVVLLDATGSMSGGKYNVSKRGIEKELEWLKEQTEVIYTETVIEFIERICNNGNIKRNIHSLLEQPSKVHLNFYEAKGGDTPLYQAVYELIDEVKSEIKPTDKVLLKVYTDGQDNSSGLYREKCVRKIAEVQKENFTVTFAGTKQDLKDIIRSLNLEESNCLEIENTEEGFNYAFNMSMGSTRCYTASVLKGEDVSKGFYKKM